MNIWKKAVGEDLELAKKVLMQYKSYDQVKNFYVYLVTRLHRDMLWHAYTIHPFTVLNISPHYYSL